MTPLCEASGCFGATTVTSGTSSSGSLCIPSGRVGSVPTMPIWQIPCSTGSMTAPMRFDEQSQWRVRESLAKRSNRRSQLVHWIHHIDDEREFRFEPFAQSLAPRLQAVHVIGNGARILQQRAPILGENRVPCTPIEQRHTELDFQIGERLTDDGLRAPQLP